MKKIFIHIQYWMTFVLIPLVVIFLELQRVYGDLMIVWDMKRQLSAQWDRYTQWIQNNENS